jgi:hypothetical protein
MEFDFEKSFAVLVVFSIAISGCASFGGGTSTASKSPQTETYTSITSFPSPTSSTTPTTTIWDPGTQYLGVVNVSNDTAMRYEKDERYNYENLTEKQKDVFVESLECDCLVKQGIFKFNSQIIKVVKYQGEWYYLQVSIN